MLLQAAIPLMERRRHFHSRDADEAREFLRAKEYEVELARRDAARIDLRVNGVYLPRAYVGFYQYGAPLSARTHTARHDYWINLPLLEPIEATIGEETFVCGPDKAFVASPTLRYAVRTQGQGARVHVQIGEDHLRRQLGALLGDYPTRPIEFAPSMDLTRGYGRALALCIRQAISHLENDDQFTQSPIPTGLFEDIVTTKLLFSQPNNYSEALRRLDKPPAPGSVKRALDFMSAGIASPLGIADIAAAAGVPGRTLFRHFRDAYGASPMRYLRHARFDKVRAVLLRGDGIDNITAVAMRWGFFHPGRFAVEYRKRFGETPSQTLRRKGSKGSN